MIKVSNLLKENQLIYSILHLEKNDNAIKLSCKWLDDLTSASEKMIKNCDDAFEKFKEITKNDIKKRKNGRRIQTR